MILGLEVLTLRFWTLSKWKMAVLDLLRYLNGARFDKNFSILRRYLRERRLGWGGLPRARGSGGPSIIEAFRWLYAEDASHTNLEIWRIGFSLGASWFSRFPTRNFKAGFDRQNGDHFSGTEQRGTSLVDSSSFPTLALRVSQSSVQKSRCRLRGFELFECV